MLNFLLSISDKSDHAKIEWLFRKYHKSMIKFARHRLKSSGSGSFHLDAEDVVQNAFVKITKYIHAIDFDLSEKEIGAYVLSIVANEVCNFMKETHYFEEVTDNIADEDFFARLRIAERYREVIKAIERLDDKYRTALLLYYKEEMKVSEIAALLEISGKTVYTRLDRGKRLLLTSLEGKG